jgi:hypothetical protein
LAAADVMIAKYIFFIEPRLEQCTDCQKHLKIVSRALTGCVRDRLPSFIIPTCFAKQLFFAIKLFCKLIFPFYMFFCSVQIQIVSRGAKYGMQREIFFDSEKGSM